MRTRCPACSTVFRVTPEQLRLKAGKVRCGHCQMVFNAYDALEDEATNAETPDSMAGKPALETAPEKAMVQAETLPASAEVAGPAAAFVAELTQPFAAPVPPSVAPMAPATPLEAESRENDRVEEAPAVVEEDGVSASPQSVTEVAAAVDATEAAREAGLVAARELAETPAYNRWAAGTLSGQGALLAVDTPAAAKWPFVFMSILLIIGLLIQGAYQFRTGLVVRYPDLAALYAALSIDVPLPQVADQVSIEASDLQADHARGMLVLQATLRNRAHHAQAWPLLELTLTDAQDGVLSRRVLQPAEYLPPGVDARRFDARAEIGLRLWLEAQGLAAAGYRLYVFYP